MKKCSIMLFLFAVISCAFLYGADSADTDFQTLGQIDSIIKRTEYDTALFELNKYFTFVGGSDGDFNTKRATKAAVIEYVLKSNKIEDRESVIMTGDKSHDIVGAKSAGLKSIGVLYGYGGLDEFAEANYIVKSVEDLREMFIC